ncbi:MAG: hypothetical protein AAF367_08715 [Pseudomonadota bacterium]
MAKTSLPEKDCDLIMKGGITSGVVYPEAIISIASEYRLHGVGGASAGAIGAVIAAAAEYRRQSGGGAEGFEEIRRIPGDIGQNLAALFQPSHALEPVFKLMMRAIRAKEGKARAVLLGVFLEFWPLFVIFGSLGLLIALQLGNIDFGGEDGCAVSCTVIAGSLIASALLVALLPPFLFVGWRLWQIFAHELPDHHFGLCTGKRQPGGNGPGFTDWMAERIQTVAGRRVTDRPLTIRDLKEHDIDLASMTTDLSTGRPYQLPLKTDVHYFSRSEFDLMFDRRFVDTLIGDRKPLDEPNEYGLKDLYQLPVGDDFPVIMVARMSLSFPGLISAVPLYKYDQTLPSSSRSGQCGVLKRCLFSDGGISSNFPIHFFDSFLPGRPTFGVTLAEYSAERHGKGVEARTMLPDDRLTDRDLPVRPITGVIGFAMAIVNTAKDWQDTLQRLLPGYSERIVEVRLSREEGGMNLDMGPGTIRRIADYGKQAGELILSEFNFDEHRWRRAITTLPQGEAVMESLAERVDSDIEPSYEEILTTYEPLGYKPGNEEWRTKALAPFAEALAALGRNAKADPSARVQSEENLPVIDASIRLAASTDRVPKANRRG